MRANKANELLRKDLEQLFHLSGDVYEGQHPIKNTLLS